MKNINQDFSQSGLRDKFKINKVLFIDPVVPNWYKTPISLLIKLEEKNRRLSFFMFPNNFSFYYTTKEEVSALGTSYVKKSIESGIGTIYNNFPTFHYTQSKEDFGRKRQAFCRHMNYTVSRLCDD